MTSLKEKSSLSSEEKNALEQAFEEEEILNAINSCAPDKSPGPDGFSMGFYQKCWGIIKQDILGALNHFHNNCHMVKSFNASFIALVPKKKERLKKVIGNLVSGFQNAFVQGRQITDATLIANEVLDWKQKSGTPGLLFKLDIEKAFDKLSWSFLISILRQMGFGERWIRWIKYSFSTIKYSILVNRSPVGFLSPGRGIRQGDPLSPFLFILAMEGLSRMLEKAKQLQWTEDFEVGNGYGPPVSISHLLFADDTLVFCGAKKSQVQYLSLTLMLFEALSGLHINMSKSTIYPVNEVPDLEDMAAIMCCPTGSFPTAYLGMPLGAMNRSSQVWNVIVEKFERRLASWQQQYLSLGGRLTLINSVLDSIPTYFMSLLLMPAKVKQRLDKIRRDFLWEGNNKDHKIHLVKWAKVTLPKQYGGLGIKDLALHNKCLLLKWHWRYNQEAAGLWKEVIQAKYGSDSHWCSNKIASHPDSTISQYREDNVWNLILRRNLNDWELEEVFSLMATIQTSAINSQRRDKLIWRHSRDGSYTVKACYLQQSSKKTVIDQWPWKLIWRTKLPPKVICFRWITLKDSCLTQNNLMRRKFQIVNRCYMCLCNSESINHLFLHCTVATGLWNMFFSLFGLTWVMLRSLREAFVCWSSWKVGKSVKQIWSLVPACILWCLWTERNKRCFDGTPTPISTFKARCLITLFGWVNLSPVLSVDSFLEFISSIDLCC
ncbi:hypothetical protein MTR67_025290 [Solanum verrucosum]|uniref:Reverse transcriptase domain-containing protein n=1 Tax=Solanum verrucosum TaxID=315347 RepID=A0AAF0R3A8_SOLVR|nr:hypothetical protein MTR67_025290 [Solanum verrucosum]